MDRELTSNYSNNTSRSRISYISNINNFIQDSNIYNQANLIDMIRNMRQDDDESNLENVQEYIEDDSNESNTINSNELFAEMSLLSNNKQKDSQDESYEEQAFDDPDLLIFNQGRASTAPTKPLNDAEEFKNSIQYLNLEKAVLYSNRLVLEGDKFDVDSDEGIFICKKFLDQLEKLIKVTSTIFYF